MEVRDISGFRRGLGQEARRYRESAQLMRDLWDFIESMPEFTMNDVKRIGKLRRAGDSKAKKRRFYGVSHINRLIDDGLVEKIEGGFLAVHGPDVSCTYDRFAEGWKWLAE